MSWVNRRVQLVWPSLPGLPGKHFTAASQPLAHTPTCHRAVGPPAVRTWCYGRATCGRVFGLGLCTYSRHPAHFSAAPVPGLKTIALANTTTDPASSQGGEATKKTQ